MSQLVSIIIPTYNRAHLIAETLDSISQQTYLNWECLIIDDGSIDGTDILLSVYVKNDQRFQYHERPDTKPKGANACRNIGLDLCQGAYVVFFDSDDLMTSNHLETKMYAIEAGQCDYVITKTRFFNSDENNTLLEKNYNFNSEDITAFNYITQKINWLTYDICLKTSIAKTIKFNEQLQAGQEYNYFSKLTLKSVNAIFIKKVITLRRQHDNSIQGNLRGDKLEGSKSFMHTYWHTYLETKDQVRKRIREILVYKCYKLALKFPKHESFYVEPLKKALVKEYGLKGVFFSLKLSLSRGL